MSVKDLPSRQNVYDHYYYYYFRVYIIRYYDVTLCEREPLKFRINYI